MKKALSIVLALVMCLSMSVMAFADDNAAGTVEETTTAATTEETTTAADTKADYEANVKAKAEEAVKAAGDLAVKTKDAVKDAVAKLKEDEKKEEKKEETTAAVETTTAAVESTTAKEKLGDKVKNAVEDLKDNEKVSEAADKAQKAVDDAKEIIKNVQENEAVAEAGAKAKSVFSELMNTASDLEGLKAMLSDVNPEQLNQVLKTTGESLSKLTNGKINLNLEGSMDGLFNSLKKVAEDQDLSDVMPAVSDTFMEIYKKLGGDENKLIEKLQSSKLLNLPVSIYGYANIPATVPVPENPKTGSTAAIAVFAVLSVAAAAAFVCSKKED